MSVSDPQIIDGIAQDGDTLVMLISDHLIWTSHQAAHLSILQEKLNTYVRFISSEKYLEHTDGKKYDDFLIKIIFKYPYHRAFDEMLSLARDKLEERHIRISCIVKENV